jgi:hypothetical protein
VATGRGKGEEGGCRQGFFRFWYGFGDLETAFCFQPRVIWELGLCGLWRISLGAPL